MDLNKMHEVALRNAASKRTNPEPYKDSRCYRKEKETIRIESGEKLEFGIYKKNSCATERN